MNDCLVFNHHSLPLSSPSQAAEVMPEFLKVCLKASRLGLKTLLLDQGQDTSWFRLELSPGYFWQDWHNQHGVNSELREQIRAFRSIATRQPLFTSEDANSDLALFEVFEASSGQPYSVLTAAAWYGLAITSFPTRQPWNDSPVRVTIHTVDDAGENERTDNIVNLYSLAVLSSIEAELVSLRNASIRSGRSIWEKREELFIHLKFCGEVQRQLCSWTHQISILQQAHNALDCLNTFSEQWQASIYQDYSHNALHSLGLTQEVSGESDSCANNPKRRNERTFYLDNGYPAYFENHIKLSHGFRLHFFADSKNKTIHVGYIGPHLS